MSVLVGDDAVVKVAVGSDKRSRSAAQRDIHSSIGQLGLDEVSIGLTDHHRRDADAESIAAHADRIARHIVDDDRSYGSSILRCLNLGNKGAAAPVDERDLSAERTAVGERFTSVVDRSRVVDGKYHICRQRRGGKSRPESGCCGRVGAGYSCGAVHREGSASTAPSGSPEIHLHPWVRPIWRCGKIGVAGASAVHGLSEDIIAGSSASAVVVVLEISCCFIKSVVVPDVVHHIVHIEQIGDGGTLICCDRIGGGVGEVEVELGGSIRTETRLVSVVLVFVGVYIISAGNGVFSTVLSVVVMPAKRRSKAVTGIDDHAAVAVTGTFYRKGKNIVLRRKNGQQLVLYSLGIFLLVAFV